MKNHETNSKEKSFNSLFFYKLLILFIYLFSFILNYLCFSKIKTSSMLEILNITAIISTLGASLIGVASIFHSTFTERVILNINILSKDILKEDNPWQRWPFLKRNQKQKLLDGTSLCENLKNRVQTFDLGSHSISLEIPTVFEDFFDLPNLINFITLYKFKNQFQTFVSNKSNNKNEELMRYYCVADILKNIIYIRLIRLTMHLGISLIILSLIFLYLRFLNI